MPTRTRRTPEQLAAYHQGKANAARAKADKLARAAETRAKIVLGAAVVKATIEGLHVGDKFNLLCLNSLFREHMASRDWEHFEAWWRSKGYSEG